MKIDYTKTAEKDIAKLPTREKQKVFKKLKALSGNPFLGKKLEGEYKHLRTIRAWPYRAIYEIKSKKIIIYYVRHRQGIY